MNEVLRVDQGPEPHVIVIDGELDMSTTTTLDEVVSRVRATGLSDIVVDASGITFIDSRGLRSLLAAARSGGVALRAPAPALMRLLAVSGLEGHFPIVE